MIKAIDIIDRLPGELQARLVCDPYFSDIPVVVYEQGNMAASISAQVAAITTKAGKRGVAIIIPQLIADDDYPELAFGSLRLKPAFQVLENVELNNDSNGTGKSARTIARKIRDVVKPLFLVGLTTEFVTEKDCIVPVPLPKEFAQSHVMYQVNFFCFEADTEPVSQCAMPQFAGVVVDGAPCFTMTSATDGADIWFTTDDSYPAPTNLMTDSTATFYSSPVPIPVAGVTVRACAYKAGSVASYVARETITFS